MKNIKAKGASAEREFLKLVNNRLGISLQRNLDQWRAGGYDLVGLPLAIEIKRQETLAVPQWIRQAKKQTPPGWFWALAYRQSRRPWIIVLPMDFVTPGETWPKDAVISCDLDLFCEIVQRRLLV